MILRHIITRDILSELEVIRSRYLKNQRKLPKRLKQGMSVNFNSYKDTPLELSLFCLMNLNYREFQEYLNFHLELGIKHLQREFCLESTLKITILNESFNIDSTKIKSGTELFDWWKLFNIALILRDNQHKNELFNLLSNSVKETKDPFWRKSIKLISMCNDKIEFETSILSDIKSIVSSSVVAFHNIEGSKLIKSKEGNDIREKIWLPIMEMYYLAYQKDANTFNILLEQYLISKKNWIIEKKEEDNSSYWIDFPLLACCSYAYDNGIVINVESDYIPDIVYKGGL